MRCKGRSVSGNLQNPPLALFFHQLKKLRPYFFPVATFITGLLTLVWRVVRSLVLPTLTRKGNLLSSLYVLFTSIIEQVISFGEAVARVPRTFELPARLDKAWLFSRKYLRQGMLVAAWALFILSSFEWSGSQRVVPEQAAAQQTTPVEQPVRTKVYIGQRQRAVADNEQGMAPVTQPTLQLSISPPPSSTPRWLLLRKLLI